MPTVDFIPTAEAARLVGVCSATLKIRAKNNQQHPQPVRVNRQFHVWNADQLRAFYGL